MFMFNFMLNLWHAGEMFVSIPAGVVPGGVDRWRFLAEGKTSNQLVDLLLEEMGAAVLREKDFFPGLVQTSCLWQTGSTFLP